MNATKQTTHTKGLNPNRSSVARQLLDTARQASTFDNPVWVSLDPNGYVYGIGNNPQALIREFPNGALVSIEAYDRGDRC